MAQKSHQWTKADIKQLVSLWNENSMDTICEKMQLEKHQVSYMASRIRGLSPKLLPKKHRQGFPDSLLKEALKELM